MDAVCIDFWESKSLITQLEKYTGISELGDIHLVLMWKFQSCHATFIVVEGAIQSNIKEE